jgi:tetratricopeptide (TPR) repeat protein
MQRRLEQLFEFFKESPSDPFLKYAIAAEYIKIGNLDLGLQGYEALVKENPEYIGTYYHLGKLYEQLQDTDKAADTYQKGIIIAKQSGNRHALGELQAALHILNGFDEDEDD